MRVKKPSLSCKAIEYADSRNGGSYPSVPCETKIKQKRADGESSGYQQAGGYCPFNLSVFSSVPLPFKKGDKLSEADYGMRKKSRIAQ